MRIEAINGSSFNVTASEFASAAGENAPSQLGAFLGTMGLITVVGIVAGISLKHYYANQRYGTEKKLISFIYRIDRNVITKEALGEALSEALKASKSSYANVRFAAMEVLIALCTNVPTATAKTASSATDETSPMLADENPFTMDEGTYGTMLEIALKEKETPAHRRQACALLNELVQKGYEPAYEPAYTLIDQLIQTDPARIERSLFGLNELIRKKYYPAYQLAIKLWKNEPETRQKLVYDKHRSFAYFPLLKSLIDAGYQEIYEPAAKKALEGVKHCRTGEVCVQALRVFCALAKQGQTALAAQKDLMTLIRPLATEAAVVGAKSTDWAEREHAKILHQFLFTAPSTPRRDDSLEVRGPIQAPATDTQEPATDTSPKKKQVPKVWSQTSWSLPRKQVESLTERLTEHMQDVMEQQSAAGSLVTGIRTEDDADVYKMRIILKNWLADGIGNAQEVSISLPEALVEYVKAAAREEHKGR